MAVTSARRSPDAPPSPEVSFWFDSLPGAKLRPRAPLDGDTAADVAIVGAGYTGLWTAYYLHAIDPNRRVV
ncbi:MAG TPA: hypothetical protein VFR67_27120, partial [Pilimelia sp.]|nr:hypothetical protein [Pilimelia sp.]